MSDSSHSSQNNRNNNLIAPKDSPDVNHANMKSCAKDTLEHCDNLQTDLIAESHAKQNNPEKVQSVPIMSNQINIPQIQTIEVSERVFMNTLLKHTFIALVIIVPLAIYTTYAQAQEIVQASPEHKAEQIKPVLSQSPSSVHSVAGVNLAKYAGTWYEIARFPMYFQRKCVSDVTATYTLNLKQDVPRKAQNADLTDIDSVTVLNACKKQDGTMMQAEGLAVPANATGSQLKVTFLPTWLRWLPVGRADYWVLDLDEEYQHALVGAPDRKYLWILSRTPTMTKSTYDGLVQTARTQGFDVSQLQLTEHTE